MPGPIFLPKPQTPGDGGGVAIDQNNKVREVYVGMIRGEENAPTYDRHIADFMTARGLTIADDEIVVIEALIAYREFFNNYTESKIVWHNTQLLIKSGAGEYGTGLKEFTQDDFLRIKRSTSFDSSAFDGTEIIDLGDIQDYGIAVFITGFQDQQFNLLQDKIYLFKVAEFGEARTYLYTGTAPVTIGANAPDQAGAQDFQLVEKEGSPVVNPIALSQFENDVPFSTSQETLSTFEYNTDAERLDARTPDGVIRSQIPISDFLPPAYKRNQDFSSNMTVVGAIDGVNTIYDTSENFEPGTTEVMLNGIDQSINDDYTETGLSEITFTEAPEMGDKIIIRYQKTT